MKASMLREEFVSNYSKNARNKIETSLRERLQNFKVIVNLDVVDNLCFQYVQKIFSYQVCHLGLSKDLDN